MTADEQQTRGGFETNLFHFAGQVARQPELRTSKNGNDYCSITVINHYGRRTSYIPVVFFDESAGLLANNVNQGDYLYVNAHVSVSTYNGNTNYSVYGDGFHVIAPAGEFTPVETSQPNYNQAQPRPTQTATTSPRTNPAQGQSIPPVSDDDLKQVVEEMKVDQQAPQSAPTATTSQAPVTQPESVAPQNFSNNGPVAPNTTPAPQPTQPAQATKPTQPFAVPNTPSRPKPTPDPLSDSQSSRNNDPFGDDAFNAFDDDDDFGF